MCINAEIQEEHLFLGLLLLVLYVVFKRLIILTTPQPPIPCCSFFCVILASFNSLPLSELRLFAFAGRCSLITV